MTCLEKGLAEKSVSPLGKEGGAGGESLAEVEKMLSGKYQNAQQACKQALTPE